MPLSQRPDVPLLDERHRRGDRHQWVLRAHDGGAGFTPVTPARLYDSREDGGSRLAAGEERALTVAGGAPGAPAGAAAVALNLTAIEPGGHGFIRVFPCGSPSAAEISSINFAPLRGACQHRRRAGCCRRHGVRAVQRRCRSRGRHVRLLRKSGRATSSSRCRRCACSTAGCLSRRSTRRPAARRSTPARRSGCASPAARACPPVPRRPLSTSPPSRPEPPRTSPSTHAVTVPASSNLNITPSQAVTANGAMVKLSNDGDLCLYSPSPVHIVVDINGVWL